MARAMVCAPQPEAVEAGARVLMDGGNAIDAAIACAFVQGVVDPLMCGIAGFGSCQVYIAGGEHTFIDFHGRVPAAARPDMWAKLIEGETRDGVGFVVAGAVNDVGYQSITTPGIVWGCYAEAHRRFGRLKWREVMQAAIAQATNGFSVSPDVYHYWTSVDEPGRVSILDRLAYSAPSRKLYLREDGTPKTIGTNVKNPAMARTLTRIARSSRACGRAR